MELSAIKMDVGLRSIGNISPWVKNDSFQNVPDSDFIYTDYGKLFDKFLMDLADDQSSAPNG